ncbi:hypothetical protein N9C33_04700 [Crocinitomicaceae bacterium]|jgi:hypothetical protein|nr:hypothetical protein [Crocinitomicaceae bacterium]MDB2479361.1 hypothetical protein [Crocinitomicaceae bacterium]MDG1035942.1 hypothetical protein [Crocinitomicaceae bacterium]
MKCLTFIVLSLIIASCADQVKKKVAPATKPVVSKTHEKSPKPLQKVKEEILVKIQGNTYTEYYPGNKNIKFQGPQDAEKRRHGEWKYFSENGDVMSITEYSHGIRNGLMVVKHLNGQISYTGEFKNGDKIGIWRSYSENGELIEEKDWTGK